METIKITLPKGKSIRIDADASTSTYYYNVNNDTQIVIDKYTDNYINVQIEISVGIKCSVWGRTYEIEKDGE